MILMLMDIGYTSMALTPCNEAADENARKQAEAWLVADKKAHTVIIKAAPVKEMYVTCNCKSVHET